MLETLLIGGAAGTAVAAEFVIPLLISCAGAALLGLLAIHVGLEVVTALVYVLGGLALGASVTSFGRRLLSAWLLAAGAIVLLPLLWTAVFVTGAALMLDAQPAGGSGFAGFVAQLYNVVAALAVFALAIMLAKGVFRQAVGAISAVAMTPAAVRPTGMPRTGAGGSGRGPGSNATPAGLVRFSQQLRSGVVRGATAGAAAATTAVRHPMVTARAAGAAGRRQVRATQTGADALRVALSRPGVATLGDVARSRVSRTRPTRPSGGAGQHGDRAAGRRKTVPPTRRPPEPTGSARRAAPAEERPSSSTRAAAPTPRPPAGVELPRRDSSRRASLERSRRARPDATSERDGDE
jgi:hypothetical protein